MWLTSALFDAVAAEQPSALAGLRMVVVGGDAVSGTACGGWSSGARAC